jgi:hypothetical protein
MANETVDLRDLLTAPLSNFPDKPNLPANKSFYGKILNMEATHSKVKGTPGFHVSVRLTDPGSDVTPSDLQKLSDAGLSLADYEVGSDFWLTPGSMTFLRRFLTSIGISENVSTAEALHLDEHFNPTSETRDIVRGLDVAIKTPPADAEGRVFTNNLDIIYGVKR